MSTFEMNDQQVAGLAAAICATAEAMGQEMNPGTAAMMAEDLCAYSVPAVKAALKACRFEVKGKRRWPTFSSECKPLTAARARTKHGRSP